MGRKHPSLFWKASLVGAIAVALYGFAIVPFPVLEIPKLKTQDLFFTARHFFHLQKPDLKEVVLVNVDDESIKRIHERWPFPRRRYAELLERLIPLRPRLIAFDFIFSGVGEPADDLMLAQALRKSGNVILASFVDSEQNYMVPLQEFRNAARSVGVVNKVLDRDLYVRRSGLFYRDVSGAIIGWPWETEIWAQNSNADLRAYEMNSKELRFPAQNMRIPYYGQKTAMVNYRFNLGDLETVPFWKVLEEKQPAGRFAGKIVLAGVTSRALHDYYHTPLGLMPGVLVNANFLVNLLNRDFIKKIPVVIDGLFLFLLVWLAAFLGLRDQLLRGLLAMLGATAIFAGGFFLLFLRNYLGDSFSPLLAGWGTFLAIALYRYFRTLLENVQLRGKVTTDPLTGLYNRRFLESRIDLELEKLTSPKKDRKMDVYTDLSILMIDIDDFKKINDTYGHQFGDDALKTISFLIKENIRKDDLAARFGGEEFCVILAHTTKEEAGRAAEKIRSNVESRKFNYVNRISRFTVSIGLASAKADGLSASRALIRAADEALYEAKHRGKNNVCHWKEKQSFDELLNNEYQQKIAHYQNRFIGFTQEMVDKFIEYSKTIVEEIEKKDRRTAQHSPNVTRYAVSLAKALHLPQPEINSIRLAGMLHDIGKAGIDPQILYKKGGYNPKEFRIMKLHPLFSAKMIEPLNFLDKELQIILQHHERFDGKGYPTGRKGREICRGARILSICDAYDAMISGRSYKKKLSQKGACSQIGEGSGSQFDPNLSQIFLSLVESQALNQPTSSAAGTQKMTAMESNLKRNR